MGLDQTPKRSPRVDTRTNTSRGRLIDLKAQQKVRARRKQRDSRGNGGRPQGARNSEAHHAVASGSGNGHREEPLDDKSVTKANMERGLGGLRSSRHRQFCVRPVC